MSRRPCTISTGLDYGGDQLGRIVGERIDQKALHLWREQRHQRRVHAGDVDTLAGFERFDRRHRLSQNGRVRRIGTKLRPQHFAERPAGGRYQDQTANVRQLLRGRERNKTAFAMSEQPDA